MSAVGVVLAGGAGRRMGGAKALAEHEGLALVHHPLRALAAVTATRAVVAKASTRLPALGEEVAIWHEPDAPRHPLTGILHALRCAGGRPVVACAVDLPLLDAMTLARLLAADDGTRPCVVPRTPAGLEPLCALWRPEALRALEALTGEPAMRDVVAALDAREVAFAEARAFTNVNTPAELAALQLG